MLEETLNSTTYSPAEVAQMLISYVEVELAAGGASAEARFFKLFPLLCKRVFGDISTTTFKHELGGWLSRTTKWERPPTSISQSSLQHMYGGPIRSPGNASQQTTIRSDPVVKLLGVTMTAAPGKGPGPLTLILAFAKEAEHRPDVWYEFPFPGLPKSTQQDWLSLIQMEWGGLTVGDRHVSENSIELMGSLLRVKPVEQTQLMQYVQAKAQENDQRRPLQLYPLYPQSSSSPSVASMMVSPTKERDKPPNVFLSMLEYYLLVFIRYPLAAPEIKAPPSNTTTRTSQGIPIPNRKIESYGDSVYYELFQEYVSYYIPSRVPIGSFNGFGHFPRPSQLFVRIIIALWLEGLNHLAPTTKAVELLRDRRSILSPIDLNVSYDLVHARYQPLPGQISRSLHILIKRALSDGSITDLVTDAYQGFKGANSDFLCLSPTMTMLQQPFFNHVRTAFRYGSVHSSQSIFYSAMSDWLMWLEPWNMQFSSKSTTSSTRMIEAVSRSAGKKVSTARFLHPKMNDRSLYRPCWEPYIASNLHLFTVPLAIFLRRARELDFSQALYKKSFETVMKVLRVYSQEVVAVIDRLLMERGSAAFKYAGMVAKHEKNLGPFAPSGVTLSLASCQEDMKILLDEVYLQHLQKVEKSDLGDRISAFFGVSGAGAFAGEEKQLQTLIRKAKIVVGLPSDYEVAAQYNKSRVSESQARENDAAARTTDGSLSNSGVQRILQGSFKCHTNDMDYYGDKMYSRPQSHEIPFMVSLLIKASDALNAQLGIEVKSKSEESGKNKVFLFIPRRINLRFLADYRNVVILCLVGWLLSLRL
jgi:hypothetical protein